MTAVIRLRLPDAAYARLTRIQRERNIAAEAERQGPFARYDAARKGLLSAGNDWPAMLGYAQTLADSPRWPDRELARHTREAYSLHLRDGVERAKRQAGQPGMIRAELARLAALAFLCAVVALVFLGGGA